jgi:hypothetical protein
MSEAEWFFLKGKKAEVERHVAYRICLLDAHVKIDPRFRALLGRLVPEVGLDRLHARAMREVAQAKAAGHPIAYDGQGMAAPTGGALEHYLDAWNVPETEQTINRAMLAFVVGELKLEWAWLPHELERLMYFMCLAWLGIQVDIESELWTKPGQKKRAPGRYQRANHETMKRHVEWFYRNRLKEPREMMAAIAAAAGKEETTVRDAIHGVERILRVSPALL